MAITPAILPFPKRLSYKQARLVVVIAVILGILFSCLQIYMDFFLFQEDFDASLKQMVEIAKPPATQAIINRDKNLAGEVLEGLLQYNPIARLELLDENKKNVTPPREKKFIQTSGRQLSAWFFAPTEEKFYPLYIQNTGKFGVLNITLDNHYMMNRFLDRALVVLMSGLARNLLLAVFVLLLFHYIVTKPLFKMTTGLGNIDLSNPEANRLAYLPKHAEDELGLLVASINQLLNAIDKQTAEREQILQEMAIAKKAAEAANQTKTDFLTNMSHEMRTPLNAVLNMLLLIQDTSLTTTQQDFLQTAQHSGMALLSLIDDILDFSKVEAGKLSVEQIPFDLRQTIEETIETLVQQAETKQLALTTLIATEMPQQVNGDPKRVRQLIANLVNNAIKFTHEGEIRVFIRVAEIDIQKITLYGEVTDTGIGIPEHARSTIFQLFEQVDGSTTRRYGGTGLGLAFCQQIVQCMEGEIGVESTVDKGSTFWFTLKLHIGPHAEAFILPEKPTNCERILVVDSHATVQQALHYYLQAWGITVDCVQTAKQALEKLQTTPFDLMLIDTLLPDMDGISLGLVLKAEPRFANIRLILLTSCYVQPLPSKIFHAYLRKPIQQTMLYQTLIQVSHYPLSEYAIRLKPFRSMVKS